MKNLDWTVASLPAGPFKRATNVGGEFFAIFRQSQHPDETWTFVKWVARPENQALWSMKSGYLPVRRSVLNIKEYRDFLDKNPGFKAYVEQMDVAQTARPMDYYTLQITRHVAEAIEKATIGGMDPKKVLEEAAAKSNKLLSRVPRQ